MIVVKPDEILKHLLLHLEGSSTDCEHRLFYWRCKGPVLESVVTHRANCCRFWEAVQQLKALPQKDVQDKVDEIWTEFLASDASCPINVDSRSYEITKKNMETLDRWSFDVAAVSTYTVVTKCSRAHRIVRCSLSVM